MARRAVAMVYDFMLRIVVIIYQKPAMKIVLKDLLKTNVEVIHCSIL
jgi:hypothetical protein